MDNGRRNTELDFMGHRAVEPVINKSGKSCGNSKYPKKSRFFGWRALHGLLACRLILANRHIIPSGGCPVCHHGAEDIKHMIFSCDRAKAIWNSIGIW
jgi:hypothetical protein